MEQFRILVEISEYKHDHMIGCCWAFHLQSNNSNKKNEFINQAKPASGVDVVGESSFSNCHTPDKIMTSKVKSQIKLFCN